MLINRCCPNLNVGVCFLFFLLRCFSHKTSVEQRTRLPSTSAFFFPHSRVMAVRLSGYESNSCRPRMALPAALFPDPDRPSSTRRSSAEGEAGEESEEEEGEEGGSKEEKTGAPGAGLS